MTDFLDTKWDRVVIPPGVTPDYHKPNTRGILFIVLCLLLFTISTTFGAMRVYTKAFITHAMGWDDYTCIATMVGNLIWTIGNINMMRVGVGKHSWDVDTTFRSYEYFRHNSFMVNVTYFCVIMFVKMSVLFLYLRTFTESRRFRYTVIATLVILVASHVPLLAVYVFWITPVSCSWIQTETQEEYFTICHVNVEFNLFLRLVLTLAVLTVVLDIVVLSLPCRAVWRLHLPKRQKVVILVTLVSGVVVTIASILRMVAIIQLFYFYADEYLQEWQVNFVSMIEVNLALICISLPVLKAFTRRFFPSLLRLWTTPGKTGGSSSWRLRTKSNQTSSHAARAGQMRNADSHEDGLVSNAAYLELGEDGKSDKNIAMEAIQVKTAIDVESRVTSST